MMEGIIKMNIEQIFPVVVGLAIGGLVGAWLYSKLIEARIGNQIIEYKKKKGLK